MEKPILFSGSMVQAILKGRKTQTRRIIKPQPDHIDQWKKMPCIDTGLDQCGYQTYQFIKPYCTEGDTLWVRETWRTDKAYDSVSPKQIDSGASLFYEADHQIGRINDRSGTTEWGRIRQSIFMPRWASRITLEVIDVKGDRLQNISDEDAMAEGVKIGSSSMGHTFNAREHFGALWDSINLKRGSGWDINQMVWVYKFKRIDT